MGGEGRLGEGETLSLSLSVLFRSRCASIAASDTNVASFLSIHFHSVDLYCIQNMTTGSTKT